MFCKIAELLTEVPASNGLMPRCVDYICNEEGCADIIIRTTLYHPEHYPEATPDLVEYLASGSLFYKELLKFNGVMLHASAVELDGKAYLFSGPCGTGKSTHTRLWQQVFATRANVFNDDKPALRRLENRWYAYGTPWCGKDGININMKVPLAGICFLKQASENRIRRLDSIEAIPLFIAQTLRKFNDAANTALLLENLDQLVREIPIFELENRPEPEAAILSYETMHRIAEEKGL